MNLLLVLARGSQFAAALVLLGTVTVLCLLRRSRPGGSRVPRQAGRPRYFRLLTRTLWVAGLSLVGWVLLQARNMAGEPLNAHILEAVVLDTQFGRIMLWRFGTLLLFAALLATSLRSGWLEGAAWLAAAVGLALLAWVGHVAAAVPGSNLQITMQVAHLLALGIWIGGLPAFLIFLTPSSLDRCDQPLHTAANATRLFSHICIVCVAVVVISGISNAAYLLRSAADLVDTAYGGILLAKIGLLALLLGFAADNLLRARPGLERMALAPDGPASHDAGCVRRIRRNVAFETALSAVILLLVGAFGVASPPA